MNVWVEAARPRTLSAAVVPVAVGTASVDRFIPWRGGATLLVSVGIQIAVNYANDLFDAQRGVDTARRIGPRRATSSGLVTARQMRFAMLLTLVPVVFAGGALAIAVGPELWLVGIACVLAMLGYSGGPKPYASMGLGEVFVFVFFGIVATVGAAYVQIERLDALSLTAAFPVGLLAVAILVVNNLRDISTDLAAGKKTLAVRLGSARTRTLYVLLLVLTFSILPLVAFVASSPWPFMAFGAIPLAPSAARLVSGSERTSLLPALGATARLQLAFGALLALGLWIAR